MSEIEQLVIQWGPVGACSIAILMSHLHFVLRVLPRALRAIRRELRLTRSYQTDILRELVDRRLAKRTEKAPVKPKRRVR